MAQEIASSALFADANLVAYYKLENTSDSKGVNTLTNNGSVAFNPAKFNNGASFTTANSLSVASNLGTTNGAVTFHLWVQISGEPGSGTTYTLFNCRTTNSSPIDWRIDYQNVAGTKSLFFVRSKPGVADQGPTYTVTLGTTSFHQIDFTYDGSNIHGYVDGVDQTGASAASGVGAAGADTFVMGAISVTPTNACFAILDDFAVFTRALTSIEILSLFNSASNITLLRA